ncbi:MAG TPA: insulinase family protein [Bacteroidales bacterium]|nr:insulinase family protein [Bacteroidales bacterium]
MKNIPIRILSLMLFISATWGISIAQVKSDQQLPVDKHVRIGKLENGLAYYIRKNPKPENRIEMRLVVKAGSVLEDDDQQGLAHFIEHMCFNGTRHFEKNELIEYLQSVGVQFGPEINAYTSFDETVYMLTLPADSPRIVENGFLVMEDWAHAVSFDTSEINKERGVVIEEWRINTGAFQRMRDKNLPVILKDSRYAERLPIGKKEIIENASYEAIRRFYKDWYRPELMAFIVVGDIDMDTTEARIKEHFSRLEPLINPRKRVQHEIPDHDETLVTVATDKESPVTVVSIYCKSDTRKFSTYQDYLKMVQYSLITGMLNQRLGELKDLPQPPFIDAGSYYGEFLGDKSVFVSQALVSDTGIAKGLQTLLIENERLKLHGFTEGELERYKKILLNQYERYYNERDKTESSGFADEYIRNFLQDEPIPGIEFEYQFVKEELPGITLAEVNDLTEELITSQNRVIVVNAPEKEELVIPGETDLLVLANNIRSNEISPYTDKVSGTDIMPFKPEKGRILFTRKLSDIDAVELKLSNGAKVILKSTDFKNDEILFRAESPGGQSLYTDDDHQTAANASSIRNESGLGEYSKIELQKLLAGKTVGLSGRVGMYSEGLNGFASPKDLEALMQLIHLEFTQPRKDETAFLSYINRIKAYYQNILSDPTQYFFDQFNRIQSRNHPRADRIPAGKEIEMIDFDRSYEIAADRFSNAGDFYFFFVGSFDMDSIKPLIEKYIASIPSSGENEMWKDLGIRPPAEKLDEQIFKGADPKSFVIIYFEKEKPWNEDDAYLFSELGSLLDRKYVETIREEMSGVYYVEASAGLGKIPYERAFLKILFPCSPDNVDSLTSAILKEITKIQAEGVKEDDLQSTQEIQRRNMEENLKTNGYWIGSLQEIYRNKMSMNLLIDYNASIQKITSEELKRIANEYIDTGTYLRVSLFPVGSKTQ